MRMTLALVLAFAFTSTVISARAEDYPSRPIRLIVPFAAGGAADSVARILGKRVGDALGQTIVVEDRGGGAAIIGTELVKKADPDGYTLLLGQSGPISINPSIYAALSYDPEKDFVPIAMTTSYPYVMVVSPALGVKTLADFVALAKRRPGELNYGTAGVGAANHLVTELFDSRAGITTLSARIGRRWAHYGYVALVLGAYIALALSVIAGILPAWTMLAILSLPFLAQVIRSAELGASGQARAIAMIDLQTARLHLAFGSLLVLGLVASRLVGG